MPDQAGAFSVCRIIGRYDQDASVIHIRFHSKGNPSSDLPVQIFSMSVVGDIT